MVWLTQEQSLEEQSKFHVKKEEQFILIGGLTLNLAAYDIIKQSEIIKDSLDTTFEILKLVEFSPKQDSRFEKLKQELAPMYSPGLEFCVLLGGRFVKKVYKVFWTIALFF